MYYYVHVLSQGKIFATYTMEDYLAALSKMHELKDIGLECKIEKQK